MVNNMNALTHQNIKDKHLHMTNKLTDNDNETLHNQKRKSPRSGGFLKWSGPARALRRLLDLFEI